MYFLYFYSCLACTCSLKICIGNPTERLEEKLSGLVMDGCRRCMVTISRYHCSLVSCGLFISFFCCGDFSLTI